MCVWAEIIFFKKKEAMSRYNDSLEKGGYVDPQGGIQANKKKNTDKWNEGSLNPLLDWFEFLLLFLNLPARKKRDSYSQWKKKMLFSLRWFSHEIRKIRN